MRADVRARRRRRRARAVADHAWFAGVRLAAALVARGSRAWRCLATRCSARSQRRVRWPSFARRMLQRSRPVRLTVVDVFPGGPADQAGIRKNTTEIVISLSAHRLRSRGVPFDCRVASHRSATSRRCICIAPVAFDAADRRDCINRGGLDARSTADLVDRRARRGVAWLRQHLGPLAQMTAFLAGAARADATRRARHDRHVDDARVDCDRGGQQRAAARHHMQAVPIFGPVVLLVSTGSSRALSFPIIGLAVLYFPSRAPILDRHRWIVPAVIAASPADVRHRHRRARRSSADSTARCRRWRGSRCTAGRSKRRSRSALAVNVLIVIEGIGRYRVNLDADERRRIQIVVFTGVPAVFAYALKIGIPLLLGLAGPARSSCRGRSKHFCRRSCCCRRLACPTPWRCGTCSARAPCCAAACSTHSRGTRLTALVVIPVVALVGVAGPAARPVARDDRQRPAAVLPVLPRDARAWRCRYRDRGATLARSALLPRRVRRARDPGVARGTRPVRSRSARPGRDGRHADRFGAAPGKHRRVRIGFADGLEPLRRVRAGVDAARRGDAAARRQRRDHAAAMVRQTARSVPGR